MRAVACAAVFVVLGALSWHVGANETAPEDRMVEADHERYFFEMETNERQLLLQKVRSLVKGDSVAHVKEVLGAPTYDQRVLSKKGEFRGRILTYYVKIWKKGLANRKYDRYVWLEFDSKDQLVRIVENLEPNEDNQSEAPSVNK